SACWSWLKQRLDRADVPERRARGIKPRVGEQAKGARPREPSKRALQESRRSADEADPHRCMGAPPSLVPLVPNPCAGRLSPSIAMTIAHRVRKACPARDPATLAQLGAHLGEVLEVALVIAGKAQDDVAHPGRHVALQPLLQAGGGSRKAHLARAHGVS